jgi:hypothetical protein
MPGGTILAKYKQDAGQKPTPLMLKAKALNINCLTLKI